MIFPKFSAGKANVLALFSFALVGVAAGNQELVIPTTRAFYDPESRTIIASIIHPKLAEPTQPKVLSVKYFDDECANEVTEGTMDTEITPVPLGDNSGLYESTVSNTLDVLSDVTSQSLFTVTAGDPDTAAYTYCVEYTLASSTGVILDVARYDINLDASLDGSVSTGVEVTSEIGTTGTLDAFTARAFLCEVGASNAVTELDPTQVTYFNPSTVTICIESEDHPEASIIGITSLNLDGPAPQQVIAAADLFTTPAADGAVVPGSPVLPCVSPTASAPKDGVQTCAVTVPIDAAFFAAVDAQQLAGGSDAATLTASGTMLMRFGTTGRRLREGRVLTQFGATAAVEFPIRAVNNGVEAASTCTIFIPFVCAFWELLSRVFRGIFGFFGRMNPFA